MALETRPTQEESGAGAEGGQGAVGAAFECKIIHTASARTMGN